MSPAKGYYSVIQYCPDPSKAEAANIGVLLFCPEARFLRGRVSRGNDRISRFFGRDTFDAEQVNAAKEAIVSRLEVQQGDLRTLDDLIHFVETRANEMIATSPRPMKVIDAEADLDRLFEELVGGRARQSPSTAEPEVPELDMRFREPDFRGRITFDTSIDVPVVRRTLHIPYAYQNGTINLIKPYRFPSSDTRASNAAMQLAVEGDLIQRHHEAGHKRKLIVVSSFAEPDPNCTSRICSLFDEYKIRVVPQEGIADFVSEVDREAHRIEA